MNGTTTIPAARAAPTSRPARSSAPALAKEPLAVMPSPAEGAQVIRLPRSTRFAESPERAVAAVHTEYAEIADRARQVLRSMDTEAVDIHRILMNVAQQTRIDQQGSLDQAQTTIETNRRVRDRIQERVKEIQAELQELQEEIADLQAEIDGHNVAEKAGEGIASAFGGGKGKRLAKKQANLTIQQGHLREAEARLENAKKLIEHGHEIMESSIQDLKKIVERINRSIQLVSDAVNKETNALGRS